MNDDEKDALKHAAKRGNGWILVEPGSALHKICSRLSESGMLEDRGAVEWCAGEIAYAITPAGRTEAKRQEEQDVPRLKRSQLMYRQFLNEDPGVRFMDWLRSRVKDPGKKSREMHIEKKKQKRKSISVRGDTYTRLAWYAHLQGKSVSSMVEEWIAGGIPADLVMPQLETRDVAAGRDAFRGTGTDRIRPLQHDDALGLSRTRSRTMKRLTRTLTRIASLRPVKTPATTDCLRSPTLWSVPATPRL